MNYRIEDLVTTFLDRTGGAPAPEEPGIAVGLVEGSGLANHWVRGSARIGEEVPIGLDSRFHVASLAKHFTAAAVLQLERQQALHLDNTVSQVLPESPVPNADQITIRHLIQHSSGLRDQWVVADLCGWRGGDLLSTDDIWWMFEHQKRVNFEPGSKFSYCNTGYTLLALIVERLSGSSFPSFMDTHLFLPLGMKDTRFRSRHTDYRPQDAFAYRA